MDPPTGGPNPEEQMEVLPSEVGRWLSSPSGGVDGLRLVDCREDDEFAICGIDGASRMPLSRFPDVTDGFVRATPADTLVVVYCHHGMRSLHATEFLRQRGLKNTFSLKGGIDAWSLEVDPSLPRY